MKVKEVLKRVLQEELAPHPCQEKKEYGANIRYIYQILKERR